MLNDIDLLNRLKNRPQEFDLSQLIYIFEIFRRKPDFFSNNNNKKLDIFKISTNVSITPNHLEIDKIIAKYKKTPVIKINTNNLLGLFANIPIVLTDDFINASDNTICSDFLSIFEQRITVLWHKFNKVNYASIDSNYNKNKDHKNKLDNIKLNLSGNTKNSIVDYSIFFDSFFNNSKSLEKFKYILESNFNQNKKIEIDYRPLQGSWIKAQQNDLSAIGSKKGQFQLLGSNLILGNKNWDQSMGFNLYFKNLDFANLLSFLPKKNNLINNVSYIVLKEIALRFFGLNKKIYIHLEPKKPLFTKLVNKKDSLKFALGLSSWLNTVKETKFQPVKFYLR